MGKPTTSKFRRLTGGGSAPKIVFASLDVSNKKSKFFAGVAKYVATGVFGVPHDDHAVQPSNLDALATGAEA
jgi:hypothetical protein